MKFYLAGAVALPIALTLTCSPADAFVTLLPNNNGTPYLNHLQLKVGGSVRLATSNEMGKVDAGSKNHNGFSDGSRFRFSAQYFLPNHWQLMGFYEVGTDVFHDLGWNRHVVKATANHTFTRRLYVGVSNPEFGTLTYGQQFSVFYQAVGKATAVWVEDKSGQGPSNGINGNYDGSLRARNILLYTKQMGPVKILASTNAADKDYYDSNYTYRRKVGAALGAIYSINPDLKWRAAYSYNSAKLTEVNSTQGSNWNQQMLGTSVSWAPGHWYMAALVGYYKDFIPTDNDGDVSSSSLNTSNYFRGSARSWELYAGYTIPVNMPGVISLQPYAAEGAFRWTHYDATYNYLGIEAKLDDGFSLWLEHKFSNTSDKDPDVTKIRLRYDF